MTFDHKYVGRRDRNNYWQKIQAHNAIVTCALFAPKPQLIVGDSSNSQESANVNKIEKKSGLISDHSKDIRFSNECQVLVSAAGCDGVIKVFVNKISK